MSETARLPTGTITFVFTDIEGSTLLLTALGTRYPELLARHNAQMRRQIAAHGGVEVKTEGDSFFVVFSTAADAVGFAVDTQRELHRTDWPDGAEVRVRVGIHTGDGTLSDDDYVGLDVHRAARVAAAGHGGQVLVSGASAALLPTPPFPNVALRDLGEHRLKDLPEPLRIFDLVVAGLPSDFPLIRSIGGGNLPEQLTSFIGREHEVEQVGRLLGGARLVTLTGPGGTGKTRLSIEVARDIAGSFTDGTWFVPLDAITDPDLVPPAIARVLGVKEDPARPAIDTLTEALAGRRALIVLDNFEQVVAAAPHINRLLRDAPAPRILCSSREALHISGEQEFPVPPLDLTPATTLFIERARQVRPDFEPRDADLETIAAICRAVDQLPLAIELAAARIRLFPLPTLLARLTDRLGMLQGARRDLPERQRTLRGAIEWSWELLDGVEREVFARLAVFAGGADLAAIESVIDPGGELTGDVLTNVESLIDKSLVVAGDGPGSEPRFRMLDTIRAFAAEKLDTDPGAHHVRDRHLAHFLEFAESIESQLTAAQPEVAFARVEAEHDNIRAAIEWSISSAAPASGLRIGGALWRFWQQRGHLREGRALLERLLALPTPDDPLARGRGLTGYGGVVYWQGDYPLARTTYEEALERYREAGDERYEALALFDLGFTLSVVREIDAAQAALEQSEQIYERLGDERGRLMVGEGKAAAAIIARDLERARDLAEGLIGDYERLGMKYRLVDTLGLLVMVYLELGDVEHARARWQVVAPMWRDAHDASVSAMVYQFGARLATAERRPRDAAQLLGALQAMRDRGEPFLMPAEVIGATDPEPEIRRSLSAEEFAEAFAEGRAWPFEVALARALE